VTLRNGGRHKGRNGDRPRNSEQDAPSESPAIHAREAELAVLSAMLLDASVAARGAAELHASMFDVEKYRQVFEGMQHLVERGLEVDPVTLLDAGFSQRTVTEIMDAVSHSSSYPNHAKAVKDAAQRRQLHATARAIALDAGDAGLAFPIAIARAQELITRLPRAAGAGFRLLSDIEIEGLERPHGIVGDMLFARTLAVLFGAPGSGKSFVALDWSLSIASGTPWLGREVDQGTVVYVAPEGSSGLGSRIRAWKAARRVRGSVDAHFLPATASLLSDADMVRLSESIRSLPEMPRLVVFDTLARSMPGGDENSSTDMGIAIAAADRIREEIGCTVLLVHHTNAGGERERGSTALRGAADTMLALRDGDETGLVLECVKQKDAPAFQKIRIKLQSVSDSCTVITATDQWQLSDSMPQNFLETLQSLPRHFGSDEVAAGKWQEVTAGVPPRTFYRAVKWLQEMGYVAQKAAGRAKYYRITEAGEAAITATTANYCQTTANAITATTANPCPPLGGQGISRETLGSNGSEQLEEEWEEIRGRA
jgi:hypothetical protein